MNVYVADITKLYEKDVLEKYLKELPEICRDKAMRLKDIHKAAATVGAYSLLLCGLSEAGFKRETDIAFGENGKPYLKGSDIFFNVSHSGEYATCVISDCETGIDIEKIRSVNGRILARWFTGEEAEKINGASCGKKDAFISAWVLKESLIKAKGSTLAEEISKHEIEITGKKDIFKACHGKYFLKLIHEIIGYKISVCSIGGEQDVVLKKILL